MFNHKFRLTINGAETEHDELHDAINRIRREDPISYTLDAWVPEQTAPGARPFTLVNSLRSRYRS